MLHQRGSYRKINDSIVLYNLLSLLDATGTFRPNTESKQLSTYRVTLLISQGKTDHSWITNCN